MNYKIPTVKELTEQTENGNHRFEAVSTFAGGGGSSTGYRMAGGKVLAINEFIPEAIKTYQANWKNTKIIDGDIRTITAEMILDVVGKKKGELDVFDGSPPCSAFSVVGSREKGWGKNKKYSDSQQSNVENLFFEYIRLLRGIMPKVFIAENVAGLAQGAAKGYLNEILRGLRNSGYYVECKILDAKWLGVPQSRPRVIFVGIRNDLMKDSYKGLLHPKPFNYIVTLADAFEGLIFMDTDRKDTDITKYAIYKELKNMSYGEKSKKYFSLEKENPNNYCSCITATTGNIGSAKPSHWDNRAFSVSEIKRIMSVPDDYVLTGTYQQKVERLGRMVAPLMMKAVATNLLNMGVIHDRLDV